MRVGFVIKNRAKHKNKNLNCNLVASNIVKLDVILNLDIILV